jgi:Rad3-related DNA helicase
MQRIYLLWENSDECRMNGSSWAETMINHYMITVSLEKNASDFKEPCFKLLCLTPSFTFSEILDKKPRSIIMTSGTLQPMGNFEEDFGCKF